MEMEMEIMYWVLLGALVLPLVVYGISINSIRAQRPLWAVWAVVVTGAVTMVIATRATPEQIGGMAFWAIAAAMLASLALLFLKPKVLILLWSCIAVMVAVLVLMI